mgnify:CR=1 FL=1
MTAFKFAWIVCALSAIAAAIVTLQIPDGVQVPLHWGLDATPDQYGPAWQGLFMPPAVMVFVLGIFSILKWIEPRQENLQKSMRARGGIALGVVLMMLVLEVGNIAIALGNEMPMVRLVLFAVGIMLMVMGNFLGKTRSNFFIGIRTPWTLSSDEVWRKTHRLGGKLFMASGAILMAGAWVLAEANLEYLIVAGVVPSTVIPVVYSWWLWRQEQSESKMD